MKNLNEVFDKIQELEARTMAVRPADPSSKILKLTEELGEVSAGYLQYIDYKTNDIDKNDVMANIQEELADMFIMLMILVKDFGMDKDQFINVVSQKMEKWETKHVIPNEIKAGKSQPDETKDKEPESILDVLEVIKKKIADKMTPKQKEWIDKIDKLFPPEWFEPIETLGGAFKRDLTDHCLHNSCGECGGTGKKINGGGFCIHMISCNCKRCSPHSM